MFNSFLAARNFCGLRITVANSLDPDHDRQNVAPDLDPNSLTLLLCSREIFFEKVNIEKKSADDNKSMKNYPANG